MARIRDIQLLRPLMNHIVDRSSFTAVSATESFKRSKYMTKLSLYDVARAAKTDLGSVSDKRMI